MSDTTTLRPGDVVVCVNDAEHCWFLKVGRRYELTHVVKGDDGVVRVGLLGMARMWPAGQFRRVGLSAN